MAPLGDPALVESAHSTDRAVMLQSALRCWLHVQVDMSPRPRRSLALHMMMSLVDSVNACLLEFAS
jgi:hypothetical protein